MVRRIVFGAIIVALLAALLWISDQITLQGERTIYTVDCQQGVWEGLHCTGSLVAGKRYRYRASRSRHEVVFWIAGSSSPSGKYTDCDVHDRGNWSCNATLETTPSITQEMLNDRAIHGPNGVTIPFHAVPKWKWWALRAGIRFFAEADY